MRCGYFDNDTREYVITTPKTPTKWINYIGTLDFGGFVDSTGGGVICKGDPALNRIVKYIPQLPDADMKGETVYVRCRQADAEPNGGVDGEGGTDARGDAGLGAVAEGYRTFSPFYTPTLDPYELYECHVGLGYSRFVSEFYSIRTTITVFVPLNSDRVIRKIVVENRSDDALEIDLIPVVEYSHHNGLLQLTNADWVPQTQQSRRVDDGEFLVLRQCAFMNIGQSENYFTSNHPVSSFETDRKAFLGDNGYGSWARPGSLDDTELGGSLAERGDNIAALLHHLGTLAPGESRTVITQLGQSDSVSAALDEIHRYRDERVVDEAFAELGAFWNRFVSNLQVDTPDQAMNDLLNVHHPRQCYVTKQWSRYLSLYQLGLGLRGIGYRDSSQDVMAVMPHVPDEARELLAQLMSVQRAAGCAMHAFNPRTMVGSKGEGGLNDRPDYYGDDHLWAVLATAAYIRETGDFAFLDREIPYVEKDANDLPKEKGTVLEHLARGFAFTKCDVGAHGLPLLGFADWNDSVNLRAGAESVFTACLYGYALNDMVELLSVRARRRFEAGDEAGARDDEAMVAGYRADYDAIRRAVNEHAWDGRWYRRYFDSDGTPIGSEKNEHGRIFTNAQSWAVLSGFADGDRARSALDAVFELLNTDQGIKLFWPGYTGYDPDKGGVSTYPPGTKENGGIFLHTNPWVMIAETRVGNAERAHRYYAQINPAAKNDTIERYEIEPYCYAQNILGDEHPLFGLGRNSWLSGTASWTYQAATQCILGVRAECDGLVVDPCVPADWEQYSVTRIFRGVTYRIHVVNPNHVSSGVASVSIDDVAMEIDAEDALACVRAGTQGRGIRLPLLAPAEHRVTVTLG